MTLYTVYKKDTGEIVKNLSCDEITLALNVSPLEDFIEGNFSESSGYISNNLFITFPEKPSSYHIWDWETKTYIITNEQKNLARTNKMELIDSTRKNLALQPIQYDNKAVDADTQAQANINGKLQEIFARESINSPLASGEMFWKDADNVIHSWANQNEYKLWLQGLVIAISSRNTALYATAWTKKAEVEALTDINDIINYDVNTGW